MHTRSESACSSSRRGLQSCALMRGTRSSRGLSFVSLCLTVSLYLYVYLFCIFFVSFLYLFCPFFFFLFSLKKFSCFLLYNFFLFISPQHRRSMPGRYGISGGGVSAATAAPPPLQSGLHPLLHHHLPWVPGWSGVVWCGVV